MRFSKYNIFSKIKDSDNYFIVNPLTGNADILEPAEAQMLKDFQEGKAIADPQFEQQLIGEGYIISEAEENKLYRSKYLDFIDSREEDEVQIFFVPNYSCNFACSYCYQDQYQNVTAELSIEIIDAFFKYIQTEFANRRKYITIFGGEPLLLSAKQKELISYLLKRSNELELDVCIVTNGYTLEEYIDILKTGKIREIQVTLDGTGSVHNARRFLKGGQGTFEKIVRGVDACLEHKLNINLRMVIDKENINNLPELAQFAIDNGWTESRYFKTQVGRNYELHHCQSAPDKLFDRVSLYEAIYGLIKKYPYIQEFYKPAYSISKFLSENGSLPDPLFDSCPACKTEWAFDYTGNIYPCTATVGKADESLGTYYPQVTQNKQAATQWENRDVTAIPQCKDCNLQLACGGGCGSVAKNKNGQVCSADCRPIKELLELGFAQYF
jgi:radical SAM additional 4Fe4S-binding domain